MKSTWTWWPVSTESALCFSKSDVDSNDTLLHSKKFLPCFILWEPKKWLLCAAVFVACGITAEIIARITSLLSTCAILLAKSLPNVRDVTRCSSSRKISSWHILLIIGSLVVLSGVYVCIYIYMSYAVIIHCFRVLVKLIVTFNTSFFFQDNKVT